MDAGASICRRTWLYSKVQPLIRREKFFLHPITNVLYSRSNVGDDMAECKQEKQGMFSASRFYDHSIAEKLFSLSI
jgi:hypothetical protein